MLHFLKKKSNETRYKGEHIDLVYRCMYEPGDTACLVPCVEYRIVLHDTSIQVGYCDLRLGMNEIIYYAGNIGYRIFAPYRGNHYALEATDLLLSIAYHVYHMEKVIITCSPDNIASMKTLEKLPGVLLETVNVPEDHWLYKRGETIKNVYLYTEEKEGRC